jgi:hypothetical protein
VFKKGWRRKKWGVGERKEERKRRGGREREKEGMIIIMND